MLSAASRERALKAAVPIGPSFLGLAVARDGANLREVTDPSYRRQPVELADVRHDGGKSTIGNAREVRFAAFTFDGPEIHHWFLIDTEGGPGAVDATGPVEPRGMVDPSTGTFYSLTEAKGRKDFEKLRAMPLRPLAGEEVYFPAGTITLSIGEDV